MSTQDQTERFSFISNLKEYVMSVAASRLVDMSKVQNLKDESQQPSRAPSHDRAEPRPDSGQEPGSDAPSPGAAAADAPPKTGRGKRGLLILGVLAALGVGTWYGHGYWTNGRFLVTTDDAYVGADIAAIAPRLAAHVATVEVEANQAVRKGDVLVRLDSGDVRLALAQAEAKRASQLAAMARIRAQTAAAEATIEQAEAARQAAKADLVRTEAAIERASQLLANNYGSRATYDNAKGDRDRAKAQLANAEAGVTSAQAQRTLIDAQLAEAAQALAEIDVTVEKAKRDLTFATITAPIDGVVAARSVQVGDYVSPGKRILSVVPLADVYVDANFKETQVHRLKPGEKVSISVDAFPDRHFTGEVTALAGGTGSTFSLLPPDNATGNFTKIVQRLPVRIRVTQPADGALLRPGMSVTVAVDTRTAPAEGRTAGNAIAGATP